MMPDGVCLVNQLDLQFGNRTVIAVMRGHSGDRYRIVVDFGEHGRRI
jgi:hypothetical protein